MAELETVVVDLAPVRFGRTRSLAAADEPDVDELSRLMHKAILARRFASMHTHAARLCLRAARAASQCGDAALMTRLLGEAREEHLQARNCSRYARDCESRAEALGVASGAYAASGRAHSG